MRNPFFSIVIPTLNEEKCLPRILHDLHGQTFQNFEVIIVDGKSNDKTRDVFETFKKEFSYSQFVVSGKRDVGYQRNLGAKHANGKVFIFFDADVRIGPTYLEEVHIAFVKRNIQFATTWITGDSKKSIDEIMILMINLIFEMANSMKKPFIMGFNIIVNHSVFAQLNGFQENTKMGEDHDFVLRARKKKINLTILREPMLTMSLRRFRAQGMLPVLRKSVESTFHVLLKGPITSELFDYPMGGDVHRKKKKGVNFRKIKEYVRLIEEFEKKLIRALE